MDLTFSLLRPDDLVALTVEATNMRLDTSDPAGPRLVRDTARPAGHADVPVPAAVDRGARLLRGPAGQPASTRRRSTRRRAIRRSRRSRMPRRAPNSPRFPAPSASG